jgi:hypothetical protein
MDKKIKVATAVLATAVAVFAFIVSFSHIYSLAFTHGEGRLSSFLIPLTVDILIVAASLLMLFYARNRQKVHPLSRVMLILGVGATIAANVGFGLDFGVVGAIVSAWPAIAFIGTVEMLVILIRDVSKQRDREKRRAASSLAPHPAQIVSPNGARKGPKKQRVKARSKPVVAPLSDEGILEIVRSRYAEDLERGEIPRLRTLEKDLKIGQKKAQHIQGRLRTECVS